MVQISNSELKTHAGRYVKMADCETVYITRNGRRVALPTTAIPGKAEAARALIGILPPTVDLDQARQERLSK